MNWRMIFWVTSRLSLEPGIVSPVAISTPALLDCDESELILTDALEILAAASARLKSRLEDEFERLKLEVWFVLILILMLLSELSTLDDELDRLRLEV